MQHPRHARPILFALLALLLLVAPATAKEEKSDFVQAMLERVEIGKPIAGKLLILFPLILKEEDAGLSVKSQFAGTAATFGEPEFPDKRYDVAAGNNGDAPLLVLGGTVIFGGERDRLLRHDVILPPGGGALMRAFPASSNSEIRREIVDFEMAKSIAPIYLRKEANFGGSSNMVPMFISRNLEFRNEGDKRKSLEAIGSSDLLQSWTAEARRKLEAAMNDVEHRGRIVGAISSMRGRIQSLEIYGSRELLKANGPAYLLGAMYTAAAVALQAGKKKIPLPGREDPEKNLEHVTKEANKLFEKVRKARVRVDRDYPEGALGERVQIQLSDHTRGRAVGLDGKLVHLAVYPYDPFESQLYGSALHVPEPATGDDDEAADGDDGGPVLSDPNRMGLAELSRWAGRGHRVTHAEQRLLNGMGRGGAARGGGGFKGGGARGGGMGGGGRRR